MKNNLIKLALILSVAMPGLMVSGCSHTDTRETVTTTTPVADSVTTTSSSTTYYDDEATSSGRGK